MAAPSGSEINPAAEAAPGIGGEEATATAAAGGKGEEADAAPASTGWLGAGWSRFLGAMEYLGDHLADLFGLNDSKYQWAVDEHHYQQRKKEELVRKKEAAAKRFQEEQDRAALELEEQGRSQEAGEEKE